MTVTRLLPVFADIKVIRQILEWLGKDIERSNAKSAPPGKSARSNRLGRARRSRAASFRREVVKYTLLRLVP